MADRASVPSRHETPGIDAVALEAALAVDRMLAEARRRGADRWIGYLERIPDTLRDAPLPALRAAARRARAAYGPKDSIRDALDPAVTEPALLAIDLLLKAIARYEVGSSPG